THLGCTPNYLSAENKFKCPCHGSGFRTTGVNFEGPAPRPLERTRIVLAEDGQILVDKSRHFQRELGQWTDPEAFLKAQLMADTKTVAPKEGPGTRFSNWLTETQVWTSVFRHDRPDTDRGRVLVMLSNVFLHLHPVRIRKSGVKLRYTWCMGGLSFSLFLVLTFTGLLLMFYYRPTLEYAYTDIVGLREHVPLGIMREMHRWGAH